MHRAACDRGKKSWSFFETRQGLKVNSEQATRRITSSADLVYGFVQRNRAGKG